jgi:putative membrane protein
LIFKNKRWVFQLVKIVFKNVQSEGSMTMKKLFMAFLMMSLMASCSSRQDELEDDMENNSGTTAHSGTSDDLPAGQGDTNIRDGATAGGMNTAPAQPVLNDANILYKMSMTDTKEINEGKLGAQKAKNADVKKFAQMLVDHHTKMLNDGKATAKKIAVTPAAIPNDLDSALAAATMQRLNTIQAGNFDNEFVMVQIEGHQKALNDLNMMLNATQNADLKATIQKAIPVVQSHIEQLRTLQAKLTGTSGAAAPTGTTTNTTEGITTKPKGR